MATSPEQLITEFAAAFLAHDARAVADLYVEDGVFFSSASGVLARGRDEIAAAYEALFGTGLAATDFTVHERDVVRDGSHAYAHMSATIVVPVGEQTRQVALRATEVMRRGDDGQWRYVIDHV